MIGEKNSSGYGYLANSHLPESLSMPNNKTLTRANEEKRDLSTAMTWKRAATIVVNRGCTYDALARPITRITARKGSARNDAFTYNSRSELTTATLGTGGYGYGYDNIGNRKTAQKLVDELTYAANNRPVSFTWAEGETTTVVECGCDDLGRRHMKKVTTNGGSSHAAAGRPIVGQRTSVEGSAERLSTRTTVSHASPLLPSRPWPALN